MGRAKHPMLASYMLVDVSIVLRPRPRLERLRADCSRDLTKHSIHPFGASSCQVPSSRMSRYDRQNFTG